MPVVKNDFVRLCNIKQDRRGLIIVPPKTPLSRTISKPSQLNSMSIKGGRRVVFYTDARGRKRVISNPKDLGFLSSSAISRLIGRVESPKVDLVDEKDGSSTVKIGSTKVGSVLVDGKAVKYKFKLGSKVCKGKIRVKGKSRSIIKRWIVKKIADAVAVERALKKAKLERRLPEATKKKPLKRKPSAGCGCGAPAPPKPIRWKAKDNTVFKRQIRSYARNFDLPIYMP